jgi:hypothetical protein
MARVLGMHGEEVLARFAAREAQLPFSELDALRYFFYDLSASSFFLSVWLFLCPCVCVFRRSGLSSSFLPACLSARVSHPPAWVLGSPQGEGDQRQMGRHVDIKQRGRRQPAPVYL